MVLAGYAKIFIRNVCTNGAHQEAKYPPVHKPHLHRVTAQQTLKDVNVIGRFVV